MLWSNQIIKWKVLVYTLDINCIYNCWRLKWKTVCRHTSKTHIQQFETTVLQYHNITALSLLSNCQWNEKHCLETSNNTFTLIFWVIATPNHGLDWERCTAYICSTPTVWDLPDMGVLLQAHQSVLRVIEDTLLDAQFSPWGATNSGLSGSPILHRETGTDVTNGDCLDVSCQCYTDNNIVSVHNIL